MKYQGKTLVEHLCPLGRTSVRVDGRDALVYSRQRCSFDVVVFL